MFVLINTLFKRNSTSLTHSLFSEHSSGFACTKFARRVYSAHSLMGIHSGMLESYTCVASSNRHFILYSAFSLHFPFCKKSKYFGRWVVLPERQIQLSGLNAFESHPQISAVWKCPNLFLGIHHSLESASKRCSSVERRRHPSLGI